MVVMQNSNNHNFDGESEMQQYNKTIKTATYTAVVFFFTFGIGKPMSKSKFEMICVDSR